MARTRDNGNATREFRPRPELSAAQRRKVRRVREAIRAGAYENDLKLEVTVDRLLDLLRAEM